ncbi:succinate dehydrogenase assembly factor 2 [Antarcticirhabdus aurantiaca]|uniref:Succinate dehydrogenase assembly factor 2 n=1 Tax=Antarcticirhabdus aurantiaca TaxID=2606717 RepID=A0ACD4NVZ8_9HYPH|nr:succinate dehydrogenase assembly factor 2 [Antarcticirhabdus aurantiaca]WAJ30935.1 succinate dehydrogenase assembly factor 2 [Jeongeuplla avenae]
MTGTQRSSSDLDVRRRKALFRSWHRGIREMDLVLGRFADAEIDKLTDAEMDVYEVLMEVPDRDLFKWMTGEAETPANYDTPLFRRICAFHGASEQT